MGLLLATGALNKKEPKNPTRRRLGEEGRETLRVERMLAPERLNLTREYLPQYGQVQANTMGGILDSTTRGNVAAYRSANPDQAALLDELNQQALGELGLGATLDESMRREVREGVRSGQSARGMGFGPSDLYEEAFEVGSAGQTLREKRRAFATGVAGLNDMAGLDDAAGLSERVFTTTNANAPNFDPFQNQYAQDLFNTNYNAKWANKISIRNYNAAITGALIGAIGDIIGSGASAAGGACWVAREVFGWWDPRWILFREWIAKRPVLHHIYICVGPWLARWIADKPRVKTWVRRWMERRIEKGN